MLALYLLRPNDDFFHEFEKKYHTRLEAVSKRVQSPVFMWNHPKSPTPGRYSGFIALMASIIS